MANFFIIDHSLRKSGGHHFDYVSCIAQAANELGYFTTIGTNREFSKADPHDREGIDQFGNVRRSFRNHTYQPDSYLAGLQHLTRSNSAEALLDDVEPSRIKRVWNAQKHRQHRRRRDKFVRSFSADCDRFFKPILQTDNDHAFFTTVSELELMGLAAYLSSQPKTLKTTWHLQFHFNLFEGRTPEYEGQQYVAKAVKACFLAALSRLSYHSINFYATSEILVDQYNRLGVGEFELLPYPVSPEFASGKPADPVQAFSNSNLKSIVGHAHVDRSRSSNSSSQPGNDDSGFGDRSAEFIDGQIHRTLGADKDSDGTEERPVDCEGEMFRKPLRITCPGEVRREKNQLQYLQPLVDQIWPTHLATGAAQIVLQRPVKKWHSRKEKIEVELPESASGLPVSPVEYFSHPLDKASYVELIKSSDCGLLFYDSRVYFSRRAGVLGEMLTAGKPVIVPAGSWLAEQVQEPIFQHVDRLIDSPRWLETIEMNDFDWDSSNVPMPGGVLSFDDGRHPFNFSIDCDSVPVLERSNAIVLQFDWHWPSDSGVYCRIDLKQKNQSGAVVESGSRVVGDRGLLGKSGAAFQLDPATHSVEFSLSNAFHDSTASIKRVEVQALTYLDEAESKNGLPIGQVGIIASDLDDLSNCVDEFVKHSNHYGKSAQMFAKSWFKQHAPTKTVEHLVAKSGSQRYVA